MKKLIVVLLILLSSCVYFSVPSRIKGEFGYCYVDVDAGIESKININGYYTEGIVFQEVSSDLLNNQKCDTLFIKFLFYPDGIFVRNIYFRGFNSIEEYFTEISNNPNDERLVAFLKWFNWGSFKVCGDTIKIKYLNHPVPPSPTWVAYEDWYEIIDKNTIKWINSKQIYPPSNNSYYKKIVQERTYLPTFFTPLNDIPNSNCWLKEEKWFWCNEDDYKEYMKRLKKSNE